MYLVSNIFRFSADDAKFVEKFREAFLCTLCVLLRLPALGAFQRDRHRLFFLQEYSIKKCQQKRLLVYALATQPRRRYQTCLRNTQVF